MEMAWRRLNYLLLLSSLFLYMGPALGIRFVIDREECFSHQVEYEGDTLHASFVVIKTDTPWHYSDEGVDLVVKDPSGAQIHDSRDKISYKFEFVVQKRGLHRFCFTNKSPYHETIDFDVHVGHFSYFDQHAKDEHFAPLLDQIAKLDEALYNIQFEQHWIEAQTDRQAILNEGMSKRAIQKAIFESLALIGASVLQVYLLRRLFERKLGTTRLVVKSLKNPRSAVCKTAIMTCSDIFTGYGDTVVESLDPLLVQLFLRSSQDKKFVCEAAEAALINMTNRVSPSILLPKLEAYLKHKNPRVREKACMCFGRSVPHLGLEGIRSYGIDKLIKVAATQLSDQLPESREAARTLSLELQGFYCKLENEDPSVQLETNPDPTCQSKFSWEEFCHAKLSPLSAQAILRVTTSSQKETLVADC